MPLYTDNSTILGSISNNLTSSGLRIKRILEINVFTHTDLPEPVVPATNRCGILAKSVITGLPAISLPRPTGMPPRASLKSLQSSTSRK